MSDRKTTNPRHNPSHPDDDPTAGVIEQPEVPAGPEQQLPEGAGNPFKGHWRKVGDQGAADVVPEVMGPKSLRRAGIDPGDSRVPAQRPTAEVELLGPARRGLRELLEERVRAAQEEGNDGTERIVARILGASTLDEVLADDEPVDAESVLGVNLRVLAITMQASDYSEGTPAYASFQCERLDTLEDIVVNCGGEGVMAQALKIQRSGWLPCVLQFKKKDRATRAGYYPLRLVKGTEG